MKRSRRGWIKHWWHLLAVLWLAPAGCSAVAPSQRPASEPPPPMIGAAMERTSGPVLRSASGEAVIQTVAYQAPANPPAVAPVEEPLTLERLLALAVQNHPDLLIAQAQVDVARGQLIQAGLYPNPTVGWEGDDMGNGVKPAGKQGAFFSQEIVTGGKLRLAQAAAAAGVDAATWRALTQRYELLTRVRLAYYELLTAEREVETNRQLVQIAREGLALAERLLGAGAPRVSRPDVLRAEIELNQSLIQLHLAEQRRTTALQLVATASGVPATTLLPRLQQTLASERQRHEFQATANGWNAVALVLGWPVLPLIPPLATLEREAPTYDWSAAVEHLLARHSEIHEAQALTRQAEQQLARAEVEVIPNVHLKVLPFYFFPEEDMQVLAEVGVALPIFNRNQGNILSAQAHVARAYDEVRQRELRLTERLATAFERYENARRRIGLLQVEILPKAETALNLIRRGYALGAAEFTYTAVLQAQRTAAQARHDYVQALGELWRAASDIAGLLQE